ncbi:D-aminoacyl-tRNA deacylase 1 isoform X2 [Eupeodes corollae]|nr:D-aminoacyl-tRNA deacylase 1 isoform X2 [Eupeodes corollae]
MKTIIQRVTSAKVTVDEELLSSIGKGICVLVGFCKTDTEKDVDYM